MKFSLAFFNAPVRPIEIEFSRLNTQLILPEKTGISQSITAVAMQSFFSESKRIFSDYQHSHFSYLANDISRLNAMCDASDNQEINFVNIVLSLIKILSNKSKIYRNSAEILSPLLEVGLFMMGRDILLLQPFMDKIFLHQKLNLFKFELPEVDPGIVLGAPKNTVEDILLRSAREANLLIYEEYLLSKGIFSGSGTVFTGFGKYLQEKSMLYGCFSENIQNVQIIKAAFFKDLKEALRAYKSRLFCKKSNYSDQVVQMLEANFSQKTPCLLSILDVMTRFMSRKMLMDSPGELAQRLFGIWHVGLWIISHDCTLCETFLNGLSEEGFPLLHAGVWSEYLFEEKYVLKTTVGGYLMRIALENNQADLQALLMEKGVQRECATLFMRLQIQSSLSSPLWRYFKAVERASQQPPMASVEIDAMGSFNEARDSLCLYGSDDGETTSECSVSFTSSLDGFWQSVAGEEMARKSSVSSELSI